MELLNQAEIEKVRNNLRSNIECDANYFNEIFDYISENYKFYLYNDKIFYMTKELEEEVKLFKKTPLENIKTLTEHKVYKISISNGNLIINIYDFELSKIDNNIITSVSLYSDTLILEEKRFYNLVRGQKRNLNKPSFIYRQFSGLISINFLVFIIKKFYLKNCFDIKLINDLEDLDFSILELDIEKVDKIKFYNKQQLIEYMCKTTIKYNLNKLPFRVGYTLGKLNEYLTETDFENLYKFCLKNKEISYNIKKIYRKGMFCNIIYEFYKYKGLDLTEDEVTNYLKNILKIKSEKICIKKLSSKKMKEEFIRVKNICLLKKNRKKLIIPKEAKEILNKVFPKDFVLLTKTKDIIKEAEIQKNCLATYLRDLTEKGMRRKYTLIYYTFYNGKRYTISIIYFTRYKIAFTVSEIKGFANSVAPKELIYDINLFIKEANESITNKYLTNN